MLFTTLVFWLFLIIVFALIFLNSRTIRSIKIQNLVLLFSSYFFYGYWDWRFLSLIFFVSIHTYVSGNLIYIKNKYAKLILLICISLNILILGFFKYYNFFIQELFQIINIKNSFSTLEIILPVGISFYIFQSLTYVLDIYLKKLKPEKKILNYLTYVSFFPQLVAGPIERASSLLPQFRIITSIDNEKIYSGIKIAIVGLFMKIFLADNLAPHVDYIFLNYQNITSGTLFLGAIYFSIQIYADFCGYSLIAIGVAKLLGFNLMTNFNTPYFSLSIQDFWKRWHISLSTFFRDYVYFQLGGSKFGKIQTSKNILYTFTLSGLWHGANWTFILWGFLNGILLIIQKNFGKYLNFFKNLFFKKLISWFLTIFFTMILWIIFRSETITDAYFYILRMFEYISLPTERRSEIIVLFYFIMIDSLLYFYKPHRTWFDNKFVEAFILALLLILSVGNMDNLNQNFIYFQF